MNHKTTKLILLTATLFFGIFGLARTSQATCSWVGNTGTVASPYDHVDVQNCIDEVPSKTGAVIVSIPTATVTWDAAVNIDMSDVSNPAPNWMAVTSLTVQGTSQGNTIITDNGTDQTYNVARMFQLTTKSGKALRLTAMTLNGTAATASDGATGLIYISGDGKLTRIDHIRILGLLGATPGISTHNTVSTANYGIIDNLIFTQGATSSNQPFRCFGSGDSAWESDTWNPGSANAWYLEDSDFTFAYGTGGGVYDAYDSCNIVFRYNNVHGAGMGGHGNDSGDRTSVRLQEVYNNVFDTICGAGNCAGSPVEAMEFRGGTGVFFNNTISGNYSTATKIGNYRSRGLFPGTADNVDNSTIVLTDATADFTALTDGKWLTNQTDLSHCYATSHTKTSITCSSALTGGTRNHWDAGDKYTLGYFFNDDGWCDGNSSHDGNTVGMYGWLCKQQVGSAYDGGYTVKPIYGWNNIFKGGAPAGNLSTYRGAVAPESTLHVVEGQTYFNCTSAANCKAMQDATNIPGFGLNTGWIYTPYTYPHPLRTEASPPPDTTPPSPPTGLAVN